MPQDFEPKFEPKFGHAAQEFERYRPDYPAELYQHLFAQIPQERRRCAMDLGAGTGAVTAHLVEEFERVIAVEPDAGMAQRIAARSPQVEIRPTTAEACAQPAASVDLVTIANALHWMEAERVFENVRRWLMPGGLLSVFDRPLPRVTPAIDQIVLGEMRGPWKPHRDPRLKRDVDWQARMRWAVGFQVIEETKFPNFVAMTPGDYVGFWQSTSYGSAFARTLDNPADYWSDLEERFEAAARGGVITVDLSPTMVLVGKL